MKERPILFSGEMVRAILDGRKTQTRRVMKPQPEYWQAGPKNDNPDKCVSLYWWEKNGAPAKGCEPYEYIPFCPYGQIGDRLWVRETWWYGDIVIKAAYEDKIENVVLYKADGEKNPAVDKWHPSIHMFREYSRINLEIINTRVERLQNITEEDAVSEGTAYFIASGKSKSEIMSMKSAYRDLWESINGKGSWDKNPFVWVVEFRRIS